jgi:hypothetical protein
VNRSRCRRRRHRRCTRRGRLRRHCGRLVVNVPQTRRAPVKSRKGPPGSAAAPLPLPDVTRLRCGSACLRIPGDLCGRRPKRRRHSDGADREARRRELSTVRRHGQRRDVCIGRTLNTRPPRLACYTLGADGTGYPSPQVPHHPHAAWGHPGAWPAGGMVDLRSGCVLFGVNADWPCVRVPGSVVESR